MDRKKKKTVAARTYREIVQTTRADAVDQQLLDLLRQGEKSLRHRVHWLADGGVENRMRPGGGISKRTRRHFGSDDGFGRR